MPSYQWRTTPKLRLYSGKYHRSGFNHQAVCTLGETPPVITGLVVGAHHDAFTYQYRGLDRFLDLKHTCG